MLPLRWKLGSKKVTYLSEDSELIGLCGSSCTCVLFHFRSVSPVDDSANTNEIPSDGFLNRTTFGEVDYIHFIVPLEV